VSNSEGGAVAGSGKNIVLLADGTGNAVVKGRGSNVFKLFESLDMHGRPPKSGDAPDGPEKEQVAFYTDGVGTGGGAVHRTVTGALGSGLRHNVKSLYLDLARSYEPGDEIYLFGFSRGAFTVRTLAGLINACGVLDRSTVDGDPAKLRALADRAYRLYVAQDPARLDRWQWTGMGQRETTIKTFRAKHSVNVNVIGPTKEDADYDVPIKFIGVWDTVAALGFPVEWIANWWNDNVHRFKFGRTHIPSNTLCVRHALAIDDARTTFEPLLWTEEGQGQEHESREENEGPPQTLERVKQVWFAGSHSNVGGGYPKQGMSLVALDWMMGEAERAGLLFVEEVRGLYWSAKNVHDHLYDSRAGLRSYYRYRPRDIGQLCADAKAKIRVHESALERIYLGTADYAPCSLPANFEVEPYVQDQRVSSGVSQLRDEMREKRPALLRGIRWWVLQRKVAYLGMALASAYLLGELVFTDLGPHVSPRVLEALSSIGGALEESAAPTGPASVWNRATAPWDQLVDQLASAFASLVNPTAATIAVLGEFAKSGLAAMAAAAFFFMWATTARRWMRRALSKSWFGLVHPDEAPGDS
jgi:uncharacterized protein (DUF2235 family)